MAKLKTKTAMECVKNVLHLMLSAFFITNLVINFSGWLSFGDDRPVNIDSSSAIQSVTCYASPFDGDNMAVDSLTQIQRTRSRSVDEENSLMTILSGKIWSLIGFF